MTTSVRFGFGKTKSGTASNTMAAAKESTLAAMNVV